MDHMLKELPLKPKFFYNLFEMMLINLKFPIQYYIFHSYFFYFYLNNRRSIIKMSTLAVMTLHASTIPPSLILAKISPKIILNGRQILNSFSNFPLIFKSIITSVNSGSKFLICLMIYMLTLIGLSCKNSACWSFPANLIVLIQTSLSVCLEWFSK